MVINAPLPETDLPLVSDRVMLRWITYLQRIASLYARGRFSVRPVQAEQAPPEIRELAETLEHSGYSIDDIDMCIMHQANHFILEHLRKKTKIPPEKFLKR